MRLKISGIHIRAGSSPAPGTRTDLFGIKGIKNIKPEYCINCGPKLMIKDTIQKENKDINSEKIYSSMDFLTKCGIGLCGGCATSKGYRSCVDGTFLKPNQI